MNYVILIMDKNPLAELFKEHPLQTIAAVVFIVLMFVYNTGDSLDYEPWSW